MKNRIAAGTPDSIGTNLEHMPIGTTDADIIAFWGDEAPAENIHREYEYQCLRLVPDFNVPATEAELNQALKIVSTVTR